MFTWFRRRTAADSVEFCDRCGQVCTPGCRAETHRGRVRDRVIAVHVPYLR